MLDPRETFEGLLGIELTETTPERMRGEIPVSTSIKQMMGLVHGGVYAALAETLASVGTAIAVLGDGKLAMGMSNNTTFLRPITEGTVFGSAVPCHRGRTTWVWDVEISDDEQRVCALARVTIAVRDQPR